MVFCPSCNTILDISKSPSLDQEGGVNYKALFDNILAQILSDDDKKIIEKIILSDINKLTEYKKLQTKEKEFVYNAVKDIQKKDNKIVAKESQEIQEAFHICNNCGYVRKIKPRTKILSRRVTGSTQTYNSRDVKSMVYNDILPYTRNYICPNSKCDSHTKHELREAKFKRRLNSYQVIYICTCCKTDFLYQ